MRLSLNKLVALAVLLAALVPGTGARATDDPRTTARSLAEQVEGVIAAVDSAARSTDAKSAVRDRWDAFNDRWMQVEDPIRALTPELYRRIEERMQDVTGSLPREGEWQLPAARTALVDLGQACRAVAATPDKKLAATSALTLDGFLDVARRARGTARSGAPEAAFQQVNDAWFHVESRVSTIDRGAYAACEGALGEARAAAKRKDGASVAAAIERIEKRVAPLSKESGHVGALEAGAIILREGAEALIVLAAIAAFLGKLGAPEKSRLVWLGGAIGLAASLAVGFVLAWLFAGVATGERREVVEGFSSLAAAALLVLVGQWLHEKIRRGGWKKDVTHALESGKTLSLLLVAFFAVFREGAETVVFLAGIAPASTPRELALGTALGFGALAALAAVFLGLGRRAPVGPFLTFATALLWLLAVKFVGGGIVALQTGGLVSAHRFAPLPEIEVLGFAPTLESVGAQLALLLAWAGFTLFPRWRSHRWRKKPELSSITS